MPFSDLNDDVLRHIALFLSPAAAWRAHLASGSCMPASAVASDFPEFPSAHWRTTPLPVESTADLTAFRASNRAAMRAIPVPTECVEIREGGLARWGECPDWMLGRIKRLRVIGVHHDTHPSAQASFTSFCTLLSRLPNLKILELENTFCYHANFGSGYRTPGPPLEIPPGAFPQLRILSTDMDCCICCETLPPLLIAPTLHSLERWRGAFLGFRRWTSLAQTLQSSILTSVILKTGSWVHSPASFPWALRHCTALRELFVSFYDRSRKVDVVTDLDCSLFFMVLEYLPKGMSLDLCLSPRALAPLLHIQYDPDSPPESAELVAASHLLAAAGVSRGWWWHRVADLDYGQLKGYTRVAWEAHTELGETIIGIGNPTWLHPMVVRNTDGQGTNKPMMDEMWG